jgi:O-antigen ligase
MTPKRFPTTPTEQFPLRAGRALEMPRTRSAVMALLVVAAAVVAIAALVVVPTSNAAIWLVAAPGFIILSFFVLKGPKWCLAAIIMSVAFGLSNTSVTAGGFDLRVTDFFYLVLGVWVVVLKAREGQRGYLIGRRMLVVWLVITGYSLYPLIVQGGAQQDLIISWLRLAATFSLVWMVPYALRTIKDVEFTLGALALALTTQVGVAAAVNLAEGKITERLSGANTPNSTGMLAALILVLALHGPVPRRPSLRWTMVVVGAVGLIMTKSLASTAAAVVVLGFYGLRGIYRHRRKTQQVYRPPGNARSHLLTPSRILIMIAVGLLVATLLRPSNLPGASGFGESTTVHRLILADGGLRLFAAHPLTGIGWQRTPFEIGSPEVNAALREQWGDGVNPHFFPDGPDGASAHNTYVQILAETGILGFLAFVAALISIGIGIVRVFRTVKRQPALYLCMRAILIMMVVILVWLNDNPLFGAQPETVLMAMFLGMFAAAAPILSTTPVRSAA